MALLFFRKRGKTSNKIKRQQQTLITSKTLGPFLFLKKRNNKVKIASAKYETEQNNFYFPRKEIGQFHNKDWLQLDKKAAKLIISFIFVKTINLKLRKTTRYQLKLTKSFKITDAYIGGHYVLSYSIFLALKKRTKI